MPSREKDWAIGKVEQHAEKILSGNVAIRQYYIGEKKKMQNSEEAHRTKSEK